MRYSLRTRLTLSFLIAIVATAGLVVLLANLITANQFKGLVSQAGQRYAQRLAPAFADYYAEVGGWTGVEELMAYVQDASRQAPPHAPMPKHVMPMPGMMNPGDERLLLVDADGHVIADSMPEASLPKDLASNLDKGASIVVDEKQVGILIVYSALGELSSSQTDFLRQINTLMLIAGGVAVLGVLVVGSIQARHIVKPVRALAAAAHRVADGDFSQRVPVTQEDELGEMAMAFNTMAADLERQHELRHRVMADIAHELRTPLSVLQVQLESIQDNLTEPTPEVIAGLQDDLAHLSHLVEDLRVLTLADAGELHVEAEPVKIGKLIQDVTERVQTTARSKGVTLNAELPEEESLVLGDGQRLTQVFLNLLTNALQHTPPGGRVTVSTQQVKGAVHIMVQDTGEGIAPEDLPHVFERFYRGEKSRSRATGGAGLGLAIAKGIVEAHGSQIHAESAAGEGTRFLFTLPAA